MFSYTSLICKFCSRRVLQSNGQFPPSLSSFFVTELRDVLFCLLFPFSGYLSIYSFSTSLGPSISVTYLIQHFQFQLGLKLIKLHHAFALLGLLQVSNSPSIYCHLKCRLKVILLVLKVDIFWHIQLKAAERGCLRHERAELQTFSFCNHLTYIVSPFSFQKLYALCGLVNCVPTGLTQQKRRYSKQQDIETRPEHTEQHLLVQCWNTKKSACLHSFFYSLVRVSLSTYNDDGSQKMFQKRLCFPVAYSRT